MKLYQNTHINLLIFELHKYNLRGILSKSLYFYGIIYIKKFIYIYIFFFLQSNFVKNKKKNV